MDEKQESGSSGGRGRKKLAARTRKKLLSTKPAPPAVRIQPVTPASQASPTQTPGAPIQDRYRAPRRPTALPPQSPQNRTPEQQHSPPITPGAPFRPSSRAPRRPKAPPKGSNLQDSQPPTPKAPRRENSRHARRRVNLPPPPPPPTPERPNGPEEHQLNLP